MPVVLRAPGLNQELEKRFRLYRPPPPPPPMMPPPPPPMIMFPVLLLVMTEFIAESATAAISLEVNNYSAVA